MENAKLTKYIPNMSWNCYIETKKDFLEKSYANFTGDVSKL